MRGRWSQQFNAMFALTFSVICTCTAWTQQKEQVCPWLNKATAAGVLGGETRLVVSKVGASNIELTNGAPSDMTCTFTLAAGRAETSLRIAVHTMQSRAKDFATLSGECGSSARHLVGVGNEAVACTASKQGVMDERVIGRIRQRTFVLRVTMPVQMGKTGIAETQAMRDTIQNLAEQIAGSLF